MIKKNFLQGLTFGGLVSLLLVSGCKPDAEKKAPETSSPATSLQVPRFEKDSAYAFVARQVEFGPRVPNTEAHQKTRQWLADKLKEYGAKVTEQEFEAKAYTGTLLKGTNIIGSINPEHKKRILLAAHWDSRHIADSKLSSEGKDQPIDGADDGGSGVGVLLEVARQISQNPIDMGVDIIFFDAEDHGQHSEMVASLEEEQKISETWCLGSQYWAKNPHVSGYRPKYGILLDMVGAENARFPKEGFSMQMAPQLVNKIWKLAKSMGYGNYFVDAQAGGVTDDHYFVGKIARIPMIDIIHMSQKEEQTFGDHWHTHHDNMEIIDSRTLRAVGQVVLAVLYREAAGSF